MRALESIKNIMTKSNIARKISNKCIAKFNRRRGVMAVEINSNHGFGAKLEWALEIMAFCEENSLTPQFKFTYPDSKKGEDYFGSFFRINTNVSKSNSLGYIKIGSIGELGLNKNYDEVLDVKLACHLINKYLVVKDDVKREVDDFCSKHFSKRVLGLHYRGTDKVSEALAVSYERVERNINFYLEKFPETDSVFISSDDENFITYAKNWSIKCPIIYRNDSFRSMDNEAIHFSGQNKSDINRDAIINCLILSRCDALMKMASILSAWSKLFNPNSPLIMLNEPFNNWFPEREFVNNVLYQPIQ